MEKDTLITSIDESISDVNTARNSVIGELPEISADTADVDTALLRACQAQINLYNQVWRPLQGQSICNLVMSSGTLNPFGMLSAFAGLRVLSPEAQASYVLTINEPSEGTEILYNIIGVAPGSGNFKLSITGNLNHVEYLSSLTLSVIPTNVDFSSIEEDVYDDVSDDGALSVQDLTLYPGWIVDIGETLDCILSLTAVYSPESGNVEVEESVTITLRGAEYA